MCRVRGLGFSFQPVLNIHGRLETPAPVARSNDSASEQRSEWVDETLALTRPGPLILTRAMAAATNKAPFFFVVIKTAPLQGNASALVCPLDLLPLSAPDGPRNSLKRTPLTSPD